MITTIIIKFLYYIVLVLTSPLRLLTDVSIDSHITSAIVQVKSSLAIVSPFFPIDTLLLILGVFLSIEGGVVIYKIVMWVVKKIPTIS